MSGDFYSLTGEDFTTSCIFNLNQQMTENANEMITKINDRIGELALLGGFMYVRIHEAAQN